MITSRKRIEHARMVRDREKSGRSYIRHLQRKGLQDELAWYGVRVELDWDLDRATMMDIYWRVIVRICERYGV